MKPPTFLRKILRRLLPFAAVASILAPTGLGSTRAHVSANPTIFGTWQTVYPTSSSSDAGCQLCHLNSGGGNGWNAYGWSIRRQINVQGKGFEEAFAAIEALDSDGDGQSNIDEINASLQPGWRSGAVNTIYFRNNITETNRLPPAGVGRLDLALDDPIVETIQMTGSLEITLTTIVSDLISPLVGTATSAHPEYLFVVDQPGQVWQVNTTTGAKSVFLDMATQLVSLGVFGAGTFDERGLLGFAFHPDYAVNGLVYTYASEPVSGTADFSTMPAGETANHQSVVAQWTVANPADDTSTVMTDTKKVLLRVDQPQFNHNGGGLAFGPDGMLYVAFGDGGGADDVDGQEFIGGPLVGHGATGNGQDGMNPLGTILRIDPAGTNSANGQYGIPADNPFVADGDARIDEAFAYGFRNPYRISFDKRAGTLYAGDVGQNDIEEIDVVTAGGNYGWNHKEGSFFFAPNGNADGFVTDIDPGGIPTDLVDPIAEYDHDEGLSVIGGYVYRGTQAGLLGGRYIFGDWSKDFGTPQGRIFYLDEEGAIKEFQLSGRQELGLFLNGFGQDASGELFVLANMTGTPSPNSEDVNTGQIMRIIGKASTETSLYLPYVIDQ